MFSRLATALVLVLALSACSGGSESDSDPESPKQSSPPTSKSPGVLSGPECDSIWKGGETLPTDYDGCVKDGKEVIEDTLTCKDGTTLIVFDNAYYAVTGGKIAKPSVAPLQDTEEYGKVYATCKSQ